MPKPRNPISPHSRYREAQKLTVLPLDHGLPVPEVPNGREWSEYERAYWIELWETPQASQSPEPVVEPSPDVAETQAPSTSEEVNEPEPARTVMIAGEVPGYDWDTAREAVRNLGYDVVGRADDSTVLLILGEGGDRNGTKLRDAAERGIPCMDVREPGRFKSAVRSGEFVGGDPLPEPAKLDQVRMGERERNRLIRAWARENGWPKFPAQGRVPMNVRHAYELAHREAAEGKAVAA